MRSAKALNGGSKMKKYFKNAVILLKEQVEQSKLSFFPIFSALGTGLIFFLLGIVMAGWYTGNS